jgi:hypothetical protein
VFGPKIGSRAHNDTPALAFKIDFFPLSKTLKAESGVSRLSLRIRSYRMTFIPTVNPGEEVAWSGDAGVVRAIVMAEITRLVEDGDAVLATFESGRLVLRLATGEVFHLGEESVTRIA